MQIRGIGYAGAAALMFGLGVVLAKLLGGEIDPTITAFLALGCGGLLLTAWLLLTRTPFLQILPALTRRDWLNIFLLAFFGTALPLLLIVAGVTRSSALEGGFILQLNGVSAMFFALLLLGERIHLKQGLGILLLLLGSILVVIRGGSGLDWGRNGIGDVLILGGAIGLGFGLIPAKRLVTRVDTLPLTALRLLIGAGTMLPIVAFLLLTGHTLLWQPSLMTLALVLPIYVLTSFCLGYVSQQEGLHLLKAWEMAALTQTVPLFSTAFAILLLHDTLTLLQIFGGLLAVVGGVVVALSDREAKKDTSLDITIPGEDGLF